MGWCSGFRRKLFGNLQSYAYTVSSNKNVAQLLYWRYKCYVVIRWGYPKRRQTSELYSHSQFSHMLFTDTENEYNTRITMLELGSRHNMTDMETKRSRGKCIANALVCQLCRTFLFFNVM